MKMPTTSTSIKQQANRNYARYGDIVTLEYYSLLPENGFVPEPLFDSVGTNTTLILGWGNYLPGLHELILGRRVCDCVANVSIDAGYGDHRPDLLFHVSMSQLQKLGFEDSGIQIGKTLTLSGIIKVVITEIDNASNVITLDANHPLAGSAYSCSFKIQRIEVFDPEKKDNCGNNRYQVATFALGCFWGGELAYTRVPGVIGTRVGYTQGITIDPTYEEVCQGVTQHREAVQVVYDTNVVSYDGLVQVALDRLHEISSPLYHSLFESNDDSKQYKHGFYFHNNEQYRIAKRAIEDNARYGIELLRATKLWPAEEYHQKYLYKGGQSARKGSKDKIRCFG